MTSTASWLRRQLPGVLALVLVAATFLVARLPQVSAEERQGVAAQFGFQPESIALPGGYTQQTIREVNQRYQHINAWISSVGSAVAINDLDGDGLSNDLCFVDVRIDQVVVTPAPESGKTPRYEPFALSSGSLPMNDVMAPMGCVPGDFNEDGRIDLLIYMWGRTPILHLAQADAKGMDEDTYEATELVPGKSSGTYDGPEWNSNSATVADFDGDGHADIFIGNYFPHGPVLDPSKNTGVWMNDSMSAGFNGGEDYIFLSKGTSGDTPTWDMSDPFPLEVSRGWALASSANDVNADLLPELYVGNDFGPDRFLYNMSTPGKLKFEVVEGSRGPMEPKSKNVGIDSFKGMGVDFGDLNGDQVYDMFVSNITASFGIEESHFAFMSQETNLNRVTSSLEDGDAIWEDESAPLQLAWSGWGWDVKVSDLDNNAELEVLQATGFVKGDVNRWPQLQELATANDTLLDDPMWWPIVGPGDDVGGNHHFHFFAKNKEGFYSDLSGDLGMAAQIPSRGIATGDIDGDGKLDMAISRQWSDPVMFRNDGGSGNGFLGLRLTHDEEQTAGTLPGAGSPVIGAQVTITSSSGKKQINRVDGGSGHSGKRSHEVHFGLGTDSGSVQAHIKWRDRDGEIHEQDMTLSPGWHDIQLGDQAKEK
ncbi:CRTAC1 family protein [Actinosynnema sp. NPDC050801]|uniref:CRTAC1 family protein n=1 Tax=unclassified Actinosynnema TaxID=2637065 RepID=UPI0033F47E6E